jgi:hypothetical protein
MINPAGPAMHTQTAAPASPTAPQPGPNGDSLRTGPPRTGPLRSGNPRGNPNLAPRCGARTRAGCPCQAPALRGKRRCRMHGGASTGPRTAEGLARLRAARTTHGGYSAEMRSFHRYVTTMLRRGRLLVEAARHRAGLPPEWQARLDAGPLELAPPCAPPAGDKTPCTVGATRAAEAAAARQEAASLALWQQAIARAKGAAAGRTPVAPSAANPAAAAARRAATGAVPAPATRVVGVSAAKAHAPWRPVSSPPSPLAPEAESLRPLLSTASATAAGTATGKPGTGDARSPQRGATVASPGPGKQPVVRPACAEAVAEPHTPWQPGFVRPGAARIDAAGMPPRTTIPAAIGRPGVAPVAGVQPGAAPAAIGQSGATPVVAVQPGAAAAAIGQPGATATVTAHSGAGRATAAARPRAPWRVAYPLGSEPVRGLRQQLLASTNRSSQAEFIGMAKGWPTVLRRAGDVAQAGAHAASGRRG